LIIPRDVLIECSRAYDLPEAADLVQRRVIHAGSPADHRIVDRVFDLVSQPDALRLQTVARWRGFLTTLHFKFYEIWSHLGQASAERVSAGFRKGSSGEVYVSTNPYAALPIAAVLYHLNSWRIPGDVIECGCFKGVSAAMLSWACKLLGRRLKVADSFNGLPATIDVGEGYSAGDYSGSLEEVRRTIQTFGCEDVVTYVPGYFEESLPFARDPLALVWADVDLRASMESVLTWLMPLLTHEGALMSDEVPEGAFAGAHIRADAPSVPGAIRDYFSARGLGCPGRNLTLGVSVFAPRCDGTVFLRLDRLEQLLLQNARIQRPDARVSDGDHAAGDVAA
jgi:hypothetical protein